MAGPRTARNIKAEEKRIQNNGRQYKGEKSTKDNENIYIYIYIHYRETANSIKMSPDANSIAGKIDGIRVRYTRREIRRHTTVYIATHRLKTVTGRPTHAHQKLFALFICAKIILFANPARHIRALRQSEPFLTA